MFGPAGRTVSHHDLDAPELHEVVEVAPGGDSTETGQLGYLRRGQVMGRLVQNPNNQLEGWSGQSLWQRLRARMPEDVIERVDRVLIRFGQLREPLTHGGVALKLLLYRSEAKGFDQVMDDAALHCRAETLDVARRGNRGHVNPPRPCL